MGVRGVLINPKGIRPNMNIITRLEFELAYSDVISHSTMGEPLYIYIYIYML